MSEDKMRDIIKEFKGFAGSAYIIRCHVQNKEDICSLDDKLKHREWVKGTMKSLEPFLRDPSHPAYSFPKVLNDIFQELLKIIDASIATHKGNETVH